MRTPTLFLPTLGAQGAARPRPRRTMLLVLALSLVLQYPMDVLAGAHAGWALAIRAGWALCTAACALLLDEHSESQSRLISATQATLAALGFGALVHLTGGSHSPYFGFFPSLPLLLALIHPQDSLAASVTGALCAAGVAGLLLAEGQPPSRALLWVCMVVAGTGCAAYGAHHFRQGQRAMALARLEHSRRAALEQLAISERRRAQAEKLAIIGQLAASVMHEVNNPLSYVRSNLDFLEERALRRPEGAREPLADILADMRTGLERIQQIVSDLKGFSRMDEEDIAECSLADVVSDAARIAALRLRHVARIEVDIPADTPRVLAVRRKLAQVLLNLLVNAGDALRARGPGSGGSEVRVTVRGQGARVVLWVEDNGPGFPPEVLPRLFEPFFTTKAAEQGTGLGLALSRELVEQFGGTLVADNREQGGARLRIELPVPPASQAGDSGGRDTLARHPGARRTG